MLKTSFNVDIDATSVVHLDKSSSPIDGYLKGGPHDELNSISKTIEVGLLLKSGIQF